MNGKLNEADMIDPLFLFYISATLLIWLALNAAFVGWRYLKDPQED